MRFVSGKKLLFPRVTKLVGSRLRLSDGRVAALGCHRQDGFPRPHSYVEILIPKVMVLDGGALGDD